MNFDELKYTLEKSKRKLTKKVETQNLTKEELEALQNSINNYDYIIELADMNRFQRG